MAIVVDNTATTGKSVVLETGGARDMAANSTVNWTTPGVEWEQIVNQNDTGTGARPIVGVWRKRAGDSEAASYTFSYAAATGTLNNAIGYIVRLTGANDAVFEDVADALNDQASVASPTSPSITTLTNAAYVFAIATVNDGRNLAAPDSNYPSGFTGIYSQTASVSSSSPIMGLAYKEMATAGATGTAQWSGWLSSNVGNMRSIMFAVRPAASAGTTNITAVSDTTPYHGQTGVVVTCTNANASQGDGEIYVCSANDPDHVSAVNQTVTSWSDTSITITTVLDSFDFDTDLYLFVRNSDEEEDTSGFVIQRSARIYWRDTGVIDLGAAAQPNISNIYWRMWSDAPMSTTVDAGTGESVDASSDIEIGPITQGDLDPNSTMEVILGLYVDGTTSSHLAFLGKVALVAE
jgi:hypothetical protein